MVLIVTYDLHNPGRDYDKIEDVLKKDSLWAHAQGSVWFIDTDRDPSWWRDQLQRAGDPNDEFFVAELRQHWASSNQGAAVNDWLKSSTRSW